MDLYDQLPTSSLIDDEQYQFLLQHSERYGVSVLDYLTLSPQQLATSVNRSITEVCRFQEALRNEFYKEVIELNPIRSFSSLEGPKCFTTGDLDIDAVLNGGIYTHGITEIFGESSSGKSQLLMQLALSVQLPSKFNGFSGQCVFITTEGDLPTQRLEGIIQLRKEFVENGVSQNNIYTVTCNEWAAQNHILSVQLPILLERNPKIKLVIVDSVSHHLRVELESSSFKASLDNRSQIDKMAQNLLYLSQKHGVAVVVANQVGDKLLPARPTRQTVMDYDYQLGFMIGWKDSTTFYRHLFHNGDVREDVLTDDEDYYQVVSVHEKMVQAQQRQQNFVLSQSSTTSLPSLQPETSVNPANSVRVNSPPTALSQISTTNGKLQTYNGFSTQLQCNKKKRIDTTIPNLGLTWANHISTRIKLSKGYKASPLITSGELDLDKLSDITAFWQAKRILKVVFSTYVRNGQIQYSICDQGIVSVSDNPSKS
ncbi:putative DNA-dependent ATPase RAD57 Ecym_5304 [Eremothecium cymbalariae DBVPG|uniref:RecA family profile 1 domain-containing protein n=1 Tax=Eremothecium cymbalariae (strain CBS 270.75 / DBVPG 7215 / KCTC 17166 / NRRL Y-17582) TaxID=931890 RepID=I6NDC4_ERECY|nr:hypothetical protein Ecym_5304 [Eremothecium cymbalariae DBVPG\